MAPRKASVSSSWVSIAWAVATALVAAVFAGGGFYYITRSTLDRHDNAISELTKVLKEEASTRDRLMKEEAIKRDEVRKDFMVAVEKQTSTFLSLNEKISNINADVKVQSSRYEQVIDGLNKLREDVRSTIPGRK
jgi:hypothetical protein